MPIIHIIVHNDNDGVTVVIKSDVVVTPPDGIGMGAVIGKIFAAGVPAIFSATAVLLLITEYTLKGDEKDNGINSRNKATAQKAKKVFLGSLLIAKARITIITKINTDAEKLICTILTLITSFQITNNLFEFFNLFSRKVFPAYQRRKQLISRTVKNFID